MTQIAVRRVQMAQANRARPDGNNIQATPVLGQGQILVRYQRLHVASEGAEPTVPAISIRRLCGTMSVDGRET